MTTSYAEDTLADHDRAGFWATTAAWVSTWVWMVAIAPVRPQSDEDFMAAREAFRTGNRTRLDALAPRLRDHVLYPYVAYYRMRQRIDVSPAEDVRGLMSQRVATVPPLPPSVSLAP